MSSGPEEAEAEVIEVVPCKGEPGVEVTVYAGLPKGERADFLVQKCIEAGASRIVFFNCERCVARPDGGSMAKKLERFARIAEAARPSSPAGGRYPPWSLKTTTSSAQPRHTGGGEALHVRDGGRRAPMKTAIEAAGAFKTASVVTGPEGGFTEAEAKMAKVCGMTLCSMGERILRCETAPVIAVGAIMYAAGEL